MADEPDHEGTAQDLDDISDRLRDLHAELRDRKPLADMDGYNRPLDVDESDPPAE